MLLFTVIIEAGMEGVLRKKEVALWGSMMMRCFVTCLIITDLRICFYHGTEEWKGPKSLKDMMNFEGASPQWQQLFHNYGMTLFCANTVKDFSVFKTELKSLIQVIPYHKSKKQLWELWKQDEYKHLDKETAETIAIMTDTKDVLEHLDDYKTAEGYDMCQAMDE